MASAHLHWLDGRVGVCVELQRGQRGAGAGIHARNLHRLRLLRHAHCHVQQVQQQTCTPKYGTLTQ